MSRRVRIVVQCIVCVTLIRYLILPLGISFIVKTKLAQIADYQITFSHVQFHLLKGGYSLEEFAIRKDSESVHPFLTAETVFFGLSFQDLLQGELSGLIHIEKPTVRLTSRSARHSRGNVKDREWQTIFKHMLLIPLEKLSITEGSIIFDNSATSNTAIIKASGINLSATNISQQSSQIEMPGYAFATANVFGGRLAIEVRFDGKLQTPEFDLKAQLLGVNLQSLPPTFFTDGESTDPLQSGILSLYVRASYNDSKIKGSVRPLLEGVHLASKRTVAPRPGNGTVTSSFSKAQHRISFETIVEFNSASIWSTIAFTLKNAFEQGIKPIVKQEISELKLKRREPAHMRQKKNLVEKSA